MSSYFHPHSRPSSGHQASTHPPTPVDHHATGYPSVVASPPSDNYYLSPPSIHHLSPYHTTNSMAGYHPVPPYSHTQPAYAPQPSTSTHQTGHLTYNAYSFAQHMHRTPSPFHAGPFLLSPATSATWFQHPPHFAWPPPPPSPYPPSSYPPYPGVSHPDHPVFHPVHSPPNLQSQPFLPNQNHLVHRQPLQVPQGQASVSSELHHAHYQSQGMFSGSHNLSFSDNTFIDNSNNSDHFMKEFLQHTIIGAEFDSSDRDPPPRCHPGTRLAIIKRCKVFIDQCNGEEKMRWVVGPAGAGKSAIMQMVAEETPADASVFLSVNGRRNGSKTFTTIAYQLMTKYEPYRKFIQNEIMRDPSLLRKLLPAQFQKFIVDPFIHLQLFNPSDRILVIIDGLDECDNPDTQQELLGLISDFCLSYPTSPIVWFVASRPEPHITSFFDDTRVAPAYTKEEIMIDSNEACEDVQRYLRDELKKVKLAYPILKRKQWPSEFEFTKIATAAGGLFAYASTVVRYISDAHYGDPVSQLGDILIAIDASTKDDTLSQNNPLALLHALYDRIISKIPDGVIINTRKLLLSHSSRDWPLGNFRKQCNRLELTEYAAYGAVRHLHAVMKVPAPDKADNEALAFFHKSFKDFIFDFKRSKISRNILEEAALLMAQSTLRIVEQVPEDFDDITRGEDLKCFERGYLKGSPGFCDNIPLSWPGDEHSLISDHELRCDLYAVSMDDMCRKCGEHNKFFLTIPCFNALTTRFTMLGPRFPMDFVRDCVFDEFRSELMDRGKLKQVPLRTLDYAAICGKIKFQFTRPVGMNVKYSESRDSSCYHALHEKPNTDGSQQWRSWTTTFERSIPSVRGTDAYYPLIPRFNIKAYKDAHLGCAIRVGNECLYCSQRLARFFLDNPNQLVTVFVDSTGMSYVELVFVDVDDGVSEWRYWFFHSGPPLFE